mmetsp:Transcript_11923/g.24284  ORF Transcript_11923/g.24284 Transcript_11923/m.24284 type:complete len:145 (+) Transcript_11923:84-518(+)
MASNINVASSVLMEYESLVRKKAIRAGIFKISSDFATVELEKTLPAVTEDFESAWKTFVSGLPEDGCRFVVYDFSWQETATIVRSKVVLILWTAEYASVREKTIYASSQEVLLNKMPDVQRQLQATEVDDLSFDDVRDKCGGSK